MSQWIYNDFEADVDFTDADFLERLESAQDLLRDDLKKVPVEGKSSEIIKAQNRCYNNFMDRIFGDGASVRIFKTNSLLERINAINSLKAVETRQSDELLEADSKYRVNKENRAQRRSGGNGKKQKRYGQGR